MSISYSRYDTARYPLSRRSRGLCFHIVAVSVDYNGATDYILGRKSVCQHRAPGISVISKERRQIPRMIGMLASAPIKMRARIGKRLFCATRTFARIMNVHTVYLRRAERALIIW